MRRLLIMIFAVALLSGCATITRGSKDAFTIDTEPQGAACSLSNGFYCASTPCTIKMPRKSEGVATCELQGYETGTGSFTNKIAGSGAAGMAGNVILGGLIGAGVDAGTGAMKDIVPNPLVIRLNPTNTVY